MAIEFKANFKPQELAENAIDKQAKALDRAMAEAAEHIITRTRNQIDVDNHRFVGLSPDYAKRKTRSGRSPVPDLTFTGRMLASIASKVERKGTDLIGRIFFNSVKEAEKARGNMRLRRFFALSRAQIQMIIEKLKAL